MARARRSLAALIGLLALASTWTHPAAGDGGPLCAFAPEDPRVGLQKAGAAFIGMMAAYRADGSTKAVATLVVDRVIKGDVPASFEARVDRACPLDAELNERRGFLMAKSGGQWVVEPDGAMPAGVLERAAAPRPTATAGDAILLAKVATPDVAIAALDAAGRVVSYGRGSARPERLATCPTGTRAITVASREIAVWSVPGLQLVARRPFAVPAGESILAASCLTSDASDVVVASGAGSAPGVRVLRMRAGRPMTTAVVPGGLNASLSGSTAWVSAQDGPTAAIISADTATMAVRQAGAAAGRLSGDGVLRASPDGSRVAAMVNDDGASLLTVTDVATAKVRQIPVESASAAWFDDDTILTAMGAFDAQTLEPKSGPAFVGVDPTVVGQTVYALRPSTTARHRYGTSVALVRARPTDDEARTVSASILDSPFVDDLAAIDRSGRLPLSSLQSMAGMVTRSVVTGSGSITATVATQPAARAARTEEGPDLLLVLAALTQTAVMAFATIYIGLLARGDAARH